MQTQPVRMYNHPMPNSHMQIRGAYQHSQGNPRMQYMPIHQQQPELMQQNTYYPQQGMYANGYQYNVYQQPHGSYQPRPSSQPIMFIQPGKIISIFMCNKSFFLIWKMPWGRVELFTLLFLFDKR